MEITIPMYFGFLMLIVFSLGAYKQWFEIRKKVSALKITLNGHPQQGNRLIFMGKDGVHYDSTIKKIESTDNFANVELEDGTYIKKATLDDFESPKTWNNILGVDGVWFCRIDGIGRRCDWNQIKQDNYLELAETFKEEIEEHVKTKAMEYEEFLNKKKQEASESITTYNAVPRDEEGRRYG